MTEYHDMQSPTATVTQNVAKLHEVITQLPPSIVDGSLATELSNALHGSTDQDAHIAEAALYRASIG